MTRNQLGRLSQLDREGWAQVPDNTEAGMDVLMGGPATMTRTTATGELQTIVVDNDGSVLLTSETPPRGLIGAFNPDEHDIDEPSGILPA